MAWSHDSRFLLIASGQFQATCLNSDGNLEFLTKEGDRYIRDAAQTNGSQAMLNTVAWHPREESEFLTCGGDGAIRTWTVKKAEKGNITVRKCKNQQAGSKRVKCSMAKYSSQYMFGGSATAGHSLYGICGAADDGSIHFWDERSNPQFTRAVLRNAHMPGNITSLEFSHCSKYFLSRGEGDSAVRVWDIRNIRGNMNNPDKHCIASYTGFPTNTEHSDVQWSPDDKSICWYTSERNRETKMFDNKLYFADPQDQTSTVKKTVSLPQIRNQVNRLKWHDRINQIFLPCMDGYIYTLYDKHLSKNGALMCHKKKKKVTSFRKKEIKADKLDIIAPIGLPIIKESDAYNITDVGIEIRYNRKLKLDGVVKTKRGPKQKLEEWAPVQAAGMGWDGVVTDIARKYGTKYADIGIDQVRESILRHDDAAKANPKYVQHAYKDTQPKTLFADDEATMKRKLNDASQIEQPMWKKLSMTLRRNKDVTNPLNDI